MKQRGGRILVVEDERPIRDMLVELLSGLGHSVRAAECGREGVRLAVETAPDLVILDIQMPDLDGLEVCRLLKADRRTRAIPILILTSNPTLPNRLKALEFAADHFLSKPLADLGEFGQWVAALLRRCDGGEGGRIEVGGLLALDPAEGTVSVRGAPAIPLPPTLFALLAELARRPGEAVSRQYLVDRVWGNAVRDREVDVAVSRLRCLLGPSGAALVASAPRLGYRLDPAGEAPR